MRPIWQSGLQLLTHDVTEVTDADFCVTPINERVFPNSVSNRDPPVENTPGVEQFGSNIGVVTSFDTFTLQTPGGSLVDGQDDPDVEAAHDSALGWTRRSSRYSINRLETPLPFFVCFPGRMWLLFWFCKNLVFDFNSGELLL